MVLSEAKHKGTPPSVSMGQQAGDGNVLADLIAYAGPMSDHSGDSQCKMSSNVERGQALAV